MSYFTLHCEYLDLNSHASQKMYKKSSSDKKMTLKKVSITTDDWNKKPFKDSFSEESLRAELIQ